MGATQRERLDSFGVTQSEFLRDHPPHRDTKHVRLVNIKTIEKTCRIISKHLHGIRRVGLVALPHATVVKNNRTEVLSKSGDCPMPSNRTHRKSHNENKRLAAAMFFV